MRELEGKCKEEVQRVNASWKLKMEKALTQNNARISQTSALSKGPDIASEQLQKENDEKTRSITQLQVALKDHKGILAHWQKEVDAKSHDLEVAQETINTLKIHVAYLTEQNNLLLDCNKNSLNRLKSASMPVTREHGKSAEFEELKQVNQKLVNEQGDRSAISEARIKDLERKNTELQKQEELSKAELLALKKDAARIRIEEQTRSIELTNKAAEARSEHKRMQEGNATLLRENIVLKEQIQALENRVKEVACLKDKLGKQEEMQKKV